MRPIVADPEFKQFGGLAMWVMTPAKLKEAPPITGNADSCVGALVGLSSVAQSSLWTTCCRCWLERWNAHGISLMPTGALAGAAVDTSGGSDSGNCDDQGRRAGGGGALSE